MKSLLLNKLTAAVLALACYFGQFVHAQSAGAEQLTYQADELFLYEHMKKAQKSSTGRVKVEECICEALRQGGVTNVQSDQIRRAGRIGGFQVFRLTASKAQHEEVKLCLQQFHRGKSWVSDSKSRGDGSTDGAATMGERSWKLPPEFFDGDDGNPFIKGSKVQDVKKCLQEMGLLLDEFSTASYTPRTKVMNVKSSPGELDTVGDTIRSFLSHYGPKAKKYGPVATKDKAKKQDPPFVAAMKSIKTKGRKVNYNADTFIFASLPEEAVQDDVSMKVYADTLKKANSGGHCVIVVLKDLADISQLRKHKCKLPVILWDELIKSDLGFFFGDPFMRFSLARGFNVYGGVCLPLCEVDSLGAAGE